MRLGNRFAGGATGKGMPMVGRGEGGTTAAAANLEGVHTDSIDTDSIHTASINAATVGRWLGWFVLLGLLARIIRYAVCFPLWDDESFLCANFISRGFLDLLKPLDYHQVAPLVFLWIEAAATRIFGYSELALRLFPFVCGLISVVLFRRFASRLLSGFDLLLAVAIFAVSYPGIRYSAEAKPYGSDLLVSLVILWLSP